MTVNIQPCTSHSQNSSDVPGTNGTQRTGYYSTMGLFKYQNSQEKSICKLKAQWTVNLFSYLFSWLILYYLNICINSNFIYSYGIFHLYFNNVLC